MRKLLILPAISLFLAAPAAMASTEYVNELGASHAFSYWPRTMTADQRREATLAWLEDVCDSNKVRAKRQCARAWRRINHAYAELQAKRAAESID